MDHLSSCYFCGTALDDTLQEYAVVPPAFRDADADVTTATLCPTCQRKLERVLDAVVDAADGAESDEVDGTSADDAPTVDTRSEAVADEGTGRSGGRDLLVDPDDAVDAPDEGDITAEDVTAMAGDTDAADDEDDGDETSATADATSTAGDADAALDDEVSEDDTDEDLPDAMRPDVPAELQAGGGTADEGADEEPAAGEDTTDDVPDDETDPLADSGAGPSGDDPAPTDSSAADGTGAPGADGRETEDDTATEATGTDGEAGDETPAAQTSISALEYNKVMRLLQNREFPVDRAEIETVAANAYDLSRSECAAVIDLAVDRGLIDETDGQLLRPE